MELFTGRVGDVGKGIAAVMRLCPQFALASGLINISFVELLSGEHKPFEMRIAGSGILYMAVCAVVYLVLLLLVERWVGGWVGGVRGGVIMAG